MPHARAFTPAWLAGDPVAERFLPRPTDHAGAVARAAARTVHPAVLAAMAAVHPAQQASRDALAAGAVAVVTGQQAGLFGGPLYTLYKTASAVANARALAAETGTPCVPVFWLQSEDHDFAEIASATLLAADGGLRRVWVEEDPADAGKSVAHRRWGPSVLVALDATADALAGLPHADETMALLRACYAPDHSPAASMRALIDALFGPHGVLVVDPSDLADAAAPFHQRAVHDAAGISTALEARSAELETAGFAVQVHVRPGAPLAFHHADGPRGPRRRVDAGVDGGSWSTSALLRPLLQDAWLPTAAYVGGPAEIAYLAQLPPVYARLGMDMPLVVPRARLRVVDDGSRKLLDQLGIHADALGQPRDTVLAGLVPADDAGIRGALAGLTGALDGFAPLAATLDPGLAKATAKTAATVTDAVGRLVDRYRRVMAERDAVTAGRLDRLRARLQPDGVPQERVHTFPSFAARYGPDAFVTAVIDATVPFDGSLRDLTP